MFKQENPLAKYFPDPPGLTRKKVRPHGIILGNEDRSGERCECSDVGSADLLLGRWNKGSLLWRGFVLSWQLVSIC